jgi:hypothetical protein
MSRLLSKLVSKAIASSFILALLVGCYNIADRPKGNRNQKLAGTWEFKNQNGTKTGGAVFESENDSEGNIYLVSDLSANLSSAKTAIAGKFKINNSTNPPQLDLIFGDLTTQTIYQIDNDGQLKIANTFPEQLRPKIWDAEPQQLTKVSDRTDIDQNIKILRSPDLIASSNLIREAESQSNIRAIMRSQQQIFQAKGQFSPTINQLSTGLFLNSEFYKYQITILDNPFLIQHSAIPLKDGLKAYTGFVYAIAGSNNNLKTSKLLMCESNLSTKQIPSPPQNNLPNSSEDQDQIYLCPNGYTSIRR